MADVMKNIRGHNLALGIIIFNQLWQEAFLQKSRLVFFFTTSARVRSACKCPESDNISGKKNKPCGQKNWDTQTQDLEIGCLKGFQEPSGLHRSKTEGVWTTGTELAVRPNWATWRKRNRQDYDGNSSW